MSIPEPNRPGPPGAAGPPLRLASEPPPAAPGEADAALAEWLAALEPLLPAGLRHGCLEELSDHLRCRVHDLMLTGQPEAKAARTACEEMGDAAQIADRFRSALSAPRRRLAMNLSILGCSAVGLVAGVIALSTPREPVPVSVFQAPSAAAAPQGFLEAKVTIAKEARFENVLEQLGAPSKLSVEPVWSVFEEVGLGRDSQIEGEYRGVPVEAVLADINENLEPQQRFEWRAQADRLVFAPRAFFDKRESALATYDIAAIVRARAGADPEVNGAVDEVCQLISQLVEPELWSNNGGDLASISSFGAKLFIKAPPRMHRQVEWVLSELPTTIEAQGVPVAEVKGQRLDGSPPMAGNLRLKLQASGPSGDSARVVALRHAAAGDVAKALAGVLADSSLNGVPMNGLKVEAMPQTNALLIVGGKEQHGVVSEIIAELENRAAQQADERQALAEKQLREHMKAAGVPLNTPDVPPK